MDRQPRLHMHMRSHASQPGRLIIQKFNPVRQGHAPIRPQRSTVLPNRPQPVQNLVIDFSVSSACERQAPRLHTDPGNSWMLTHLMARTVQSLHCSHLGCDSAMVSAFSYSTCQLIKQLLCLGNSLCCKKVGERERERKKGNNLCWQETNQGRPKVQCVNYLVNGETKCDRINFSYLVHLGKQNKKRQQHFTRRLTSPENQQLLQALLFELLMQ